MNHKGDIVHNRLQSNNDYWISQMIHSKHTEMAVVLKPGLRLGPTNKIKYCERFKYLVSINKIIPNDYLTIMELMAFGKTKGGAYRGQNGNDDLAMTSINIAPVFDSPQFWDMAVETFEMMPVEYRTEIEEKLLSVNRSTNSKSAFDFDSLRKLNGDQRDTVDPTKVVDPNVFDPKTYDHIKNIQKKFFNK